MICKTLCEATILCCVFFISPSLGLCQSVPIDTATARQLLFEAEEALQLSDSLQRDRRFQSNVSSLFRAWGIQRRFPALGEAQDPVQRMDSILQGATLDRAFEVAEELDGTDVFRRSRRAVYGVLYQQGRLAEALDFALMKEELDWAVSVAIQWTPSPQETDQQIRTWLEQAPVSGDQRWEVLVNLVNWKLDWDFWRAWEEADASFSPRWRAWIHLGGLHRAISNRLPETDSLISVVISEIDLIEDEERRNHYLGILNTRCVSAELPACEDRVFPVGLHTAGQLRVRIINQLMGGEWASALEALERYRELSTPVKVAAVMAEALDRTRPNCAMGQCELRAYDSLFTSWVPDLEATESEYPGPAGDTLRAHLAGLWGGRDTRRAADFARRISDDNLRAWAMIGPIQSAFSTDIWGALDLARIAKDAGDPFPVRGAYVLLMRLGEPDLAQEVLEMEEENGWGHFWARREWARVLLQAGRWAEAREVMRSAYRRWDPGKHPSVGVNHLSIFASLDLVEEVIEWVRDLGDPGARAGGLVSIVSSFSGTWMGR